MTINKTAAASKGINLVLYLKENFQKRLILENLCKHKGVDSYDILCAVENLSENNNVRGFAKVYNKLRNAKESVILNHFCEVHVAKIYSMTF